MLWVTLGVETFLLNRVSSRIKHRSREIARVDFVISDRCNLVDTIYKYHARSRFVGEKPIFFFQLNRPPPPS